MKIQHVLLLTLSLSLIPFASAVSQRETINFETDPPQDINVPFRMFKTHNMWTYLLLDTRDGRLWQVSFTVSEDGIRCKLPINNSPLVDESGRRIGRFTLYRTENIWTFLLLDQYNGDIWQCQFSLEDKRFLLPIPDLTQQIKELFDTLSLLPDKERLELLDPNTPEHKKAELIEKLKKLKESGRSADSTTRLPSKK